MKKERKQGRSLGLWERQSDPGRGKSKHTVGVDLVRASTARQTGLTEGKGEAWLKAHRRLIRGIAVITDQMKIPH